MPILKTLAAQFRHRRPADVAVADEKHFYHRKSTPIVMIICLKYALLVRAFERSRNLLLLE
jgi:hypothetical protein